jgi:hypothetical protein
MVRYAAINLVTVAVSTVWQLPTLSQSERYIPVGIDDFNKSTVYLDLQSVEKIDTNSYKYKIFSNSNEGDVGKTGRFEEDIIVNCDRMDSITHLGSRLYDAEGNLIKTDPAPITQNVSSSSRHPPYLTANRTVCQPPDV